MDLNYSVILVGMRGAGKTTIGKYLSNYLDFAFIDLDDELEKQVGTSISNLVEKKGWKHFRDMEEELLQNLIIKYPNKTVLSTGGGCIERESTVNFLKKQKNVVQIISPINEIIKYLTEKEENSSQRPDYGKSIEDVYEKRKDIYFNVSKLDFCWNPRKDYKKLDRLIMDFVYRATNFHQPNFSSALQENYESEIVKPNFERITVFIPNLKYINIEDQKGFCQGENNYDGILVYGNEFLAKENVILLDTLDCFSRFKNSLLLPLVFFLENSTGEFNLNSIMSLVKACCRFGVEYIWIKTNQKIELDIDKQYKTRIVQSPGFLFLGSEVNSSGSNFELRREIEKFKRFYLFGEPISGSPSPTLHNNVFQKIKETSYPKKMNSFLSIISCPISTLNNLSQAKYELEQALSEYKILPKFNYYLFETKDSKKLLRQINQTSFHGASVTIPHKEAFKSIIKQDNFSDAAKKIGAVNTLFRNEKSELCVDNTDWIGIRDVVNPSLAPGARTALVVGAGGTARSAIYCLKQHLHLKVFLYNRTFSKAKTLASEFGVIVLPDLDRCSESFDVVVGTIPASSNFILPDGLVKKDCVFLDASYKPKVTEILKQAENVGAKVHHGVEMLLAQGKQQAKIWTGDAKLVEDCFPAVTKRVLEYYEIGYRVGKKVGENVGEDVGTLVSRKGVGDTVGSSVGIKISEGDSEVGLEEIPTIGSIVGKNAGDSVGDNEGVSVGLEEIPTIGSIVGKNAGDSVGDNEGVSVGFAVGSAIVGSTDGTDVGS
eukprot:maker-scaffold_6-snap-gene-6.15-mRNA-1 protein AED:0.03 eAED:0.04 QI:0/0.25/0/0.8/0.5/0.4/5/0/771